MRLYVSARELTAYTFDAEQHASRLVALAMVRIAVKDVSEYHARNITEHDSKSLGSKVSTHSHISSEVQRLRYQPACCLIVRSLY